ncbi:radical SAM protein [Psychromonas sp. SP041]|uniref:radical SAM protein n=1 Tax=Psychromonas sp. SP041 TaxID=1365007 RepID=UPI0010C77F74|nr:radical SAM protein [Psychromonas sp. SP041]
MSKLTRILFLNVTRQCNVNCPRCYLTEEVRNKKELLPLEFIEKAITDPFFQDPNYESVVIFEGGELSLIGEKNLRNMLELVKSKLPNCRTTMVANCYSLPDWLIKICHEYMGSEFETTYALDKKYSLTGDAELYQKRFKQNIKKAHEAGITVVVNVELNKETIDLGVDALMEVIRETKIQCWEFDHSIDFQEFMKDPRFNMYGSPLVETTTTYEEFSDYIIELAEVHGKEMQALGIQIGAIQQAIYNEESIFFNVKNTANMLSINADGTCTTDVLYSDVPRMFIGNLNVQTVSEMMQSKSRKMLLRWENSVRVKECIGCEFYNKCKGGPSYMPLFDGLSAECAGAKKIWTYMRDIYDGDYRQQQRR